MRRGSSGKTVRCYDQEQKDLSCQHLTHVISSGSTVLEKEKPRGEHWKEDHGGVEQRGRLHLWPPQRSNLHVVNGAFAKNHMKSPNTDF